MGHVMFFVGETGLSVTNFSSAGFRILKWQFYEFWFLLRVWDWGKVWQCFYQILWLKANKCFVGVLRKVLRKTIMAMPYESELYGTPLRFNKFIFLFSLKICLHKPGYLKKKIYIKIPGRREKINLNFCFHTSLWCLKGFYEGLKGLHKTFWGTTKKCENKNLS